MMLKATIYIFANMEKYSETIDALENIDVVISGIKQSHNWLQGELGFSILQQNPESNVIIIAMHENTEFESFQANNSLILKVIHGSINFKVNSKVTTITAGKMVILMENVFYLIESLEESIFLLITFQSLVNHKNNWLC